MMKKKLIKIILILIFIIMQIKTYAIATTNLGDIMERATEFTSAGTEMQVDPKELSNIIYNILLSIGIVVAVVTAAILGVKFMIGSAEEQADVKKDMIPFIIGCIVVFGAFGIWKAVVIILKSTGM